MLPERMPTNIPEGSFPCSRLNPPLLYSPRTVRHTATLERARKNPIPGLGKWGLHLPSPRHLGKRRIKRKACPGIPGFDLIHHAIDNGAANHESQTLPVEVTPLQSEEFTAPQPRSHIQDDHRPERFFRDLLDEPPAFVDRQHPRLRLAFTHTSDPNKPHWVLANTDEFPNASRN